MSEGAGDELVMTPSRPYLLRAIYEWLLDNDMTPYAVINANYPGIDLPIEHVRNEQMILNLAPTAVGGLNIGNDWVMVDVRFGGRPVRLQLPTMAVMAIYARENGRGMVFSDEEEPTPEPPPATPAGSDQSSGSSGRKRPALRVVK